MPGVTPRTTPIWPQRPVSSCVSRMSTWDTAESATGKSGKQELPHVEPKMPNKKISIMLKNGPTYFMVNLGTFTVPNFEKKLEYRIAFDTPTTLAALALTSMLGLYHSAAPSSSSADAAELGASRVTIVAR